MSIWYNPALKTSKVPVAHVRIRSVKYPNIISYSSKAGTIELPLVSRDNTAFNNIPFLNLAIGISTDNSSNGFMNMSTAMMALSYAMPLTGDNTYLAMGLQGNYSFNKVGTGNSYFFPDKFDRYGALNWSMTLDPNFTGFSYGYFTAGVGIALFHSGDQNRWYVGGSIRHFNHPYTEWSHSARLRSNNGIQIGYTGTLSSLVDINVYGNFSWQRGTFGRYIREQFIGASYVRHFNDSTTNTCSVGLGYRAGEAVVPNASLKIGKSRLSLYYEINVSNIPLRNYHRRSTEFSYMFNF